MPGTPRWWRLVVMAQVAVPCPVLQAAHGTEHSSDPGRVPGSPSTGELLGGHVPSPTQPRWVSWPWHSVGPPRSHSHAVRQLVTVQVPLQLQETRQLHPGLAVHAPALAPLPVQRRVTLRGRVW